MALSIEYSDAPGLTVYAVLVSADDRSQVFNVDSEEFETFELYSQSHFAILLSESDKRLGFYSESISNVSGIPASDKAYLIEIYRALGTGFDRASDTLLGSQIFYWDGEKEIPFGGLQVETDLTGIPAAVWAYSDRSLTQELTCPEIPECPEIPTVPECPDNSAELAALRLLIEQKTKEITDLIKQHDEAQGVLPNTQVPRLGRSGSSGGSGGIRFSR